MQEAQVSGVQLLKPGEYPAIVLDLVDEAFHQMTLPVQMLVIVGGFLAVRAGRNDRHHTQFQDVLAELPYSIDATSNHSLAFCCCFFEFGNVRLGKPEPQDEYPAESLGADLAFTRDGNVLAAVDGRRVAASLMPASMQTWASLNTRKSRARGVGVVMITLIN